ncbi:DNA-binding protein [Thermaerobacter sp. FW80]|uniref:helix-turn-helix domain-containing protein n=1 Tax=Thermaerobacter sp. FW80 TaxID=2546351 RepID=UPI001074A320|nr:helix-turn-helix domain-containing protein [Thermaerobacter sp. FW80]QBS37112.1 DNA-binding protein [Thermaerobacter sp. FW80]
MAKERMRLADAPDLMDPRHVMALTGLNRNTVYTYLRAGVIPNVRVGRRFLIPKAAFVQWLEKGAARNGGDAA